MGLKQLQKVRVIKNEPTLSVNEIILKAERIILPDHLQQKSIVLVNRVAHPG